MKNLKIFQIRQKTIKMMDILNNYMLKKQQYQTMKINQIR